MIGRVALVLGSLTSVLERAVESSLGKPFLVPIVSLFKTTLKVGRALRARSSN